MADNIIYRFIQNVGDYFPPGYYTDSFLSTVQKQAGLAGADLAALCPPLAALRAPYERYLHEVRNRSLRPRDAIRLTHDFNTRVLRALGYDTADPYREFLALDADGSHAVPVRHIVRRGSQPLLLVMEMQDMVERDDGAQRPGLFEQQYNDDEQTAPHQAYRACQWQDVFTVPEGVSISPAVINRAIDAIFLLPEERRPDYILLLGGNRIFLLQSEKWGKGAWLEFSLSELFAQAATARYRNYYALFSLLASRSSLAPEADTPLMSTLIAEGYKNAFAVTRDLKQGVIHAVETIAEEALHQMGEPGQTPGQAFADDIKDDCLTLVYRLLFILYAESRPELSILPVDDDLYRSGYSLEMLRDLELTPIRGESEQGYFIHDSLMRLFALLRDGHNYPHPDWSTSFSVRPIDSPLFAKGSLKRLEGVRLRNTAWQSVICALSLTQPGKRGSRRGRISYATLGLNQLGSVYESLLAYRGFYAAEDMIEVCEAGKPEKGSFLVPYSRLDDFTLEEQVRGADGELVRYPKGSYIYRLNGRDRTKSASYYTPEVLTRSTVKYALRPLIEQVRSGQKPAKWLLELKIHEPAMGAAAFQNEVVAQLADAYLKYQQRDSGKKVPPNQYKDKLQGVKAYIATRNVYGTDLNPTAIELGKLSLWLGVMHRDMAVPFFASRLAVGNAVVGAHLRTFSRAQVVAVPQPGRGRLQAKPYWEKAPKQLRHTGRRLRRDPDAVYHFLLPDPFAMLAAARDKEFQAEYPAECRAMRDRLNEWKKPVTRADYDTLLALSAKVDALLRAAYLLRARLEKLTETVEEPWDGTTHDTNIDVSEIAYAQKQELLEAISRPGSPYRRLRAVMDYWCSLFFWDPARARLLPTRAEFWRQIDEMLGAVPGVQSAPGLLQLSLFDDNGRGEPECVDTGVERVDALTYRAEAAQWEEGYAPRLPDGLEAEVERQRRARRFFHPQLEFIEVFEERGGFDVIAGNPPWLKLEFNEKDVISELYPEVVIRSLTAPQVRAAIRRFTSDPAMAALLGDERLEAAGSSAFIGAAQNYPLLKGQKANLYKCILEGSMAMASPSGGYIGIICQEGIYTDPNGVPFRKALYPRLRYHFQYANATKLFHDVSTTRIFGVQILGPAQPEIAFVSISNLYAPQTADDCLCHTGAGPVPGIKTPEGKWNTAGHRGRVVRVTLPVLALMASVFEQGAEPESAKLAAVHAAEILEILRRLERHPHHLCDRECIISMCFNETIDRDKGIFTDFDKASQEADIDAYELIYKGPQFNLGNPFAAMPRPVVSYNGSYDPIALSELSDARPMRTLFKPALPLPRYKAAVRGFQTGQDAAGEPLYDSFIDHYKVAFRRLISNEQCRSLICAIIPKKSVHIDGVISTAFKSSINCVDLASLSMSLPMDFYLKVMKTDNLHDSRTQKFPVGVPERLQAAMYARTLALNCLTPHYAELYEECWRPEYAAQTWSLPGDARLAPFARLSPQWSRSVPLRGDFERRQALVELDVLACMALGLTLDDLLLMYRLQFPVLQANEAATYYDALGQIVFTTDGSQKGVGLTRPEWERASAEAAEALAAGRPYTFTASEERGGLYPGRTVAHPAPYTRPDREADYRRAWAHFEKLINDK